MEVGGLCAGFEEKSGVCLAAATILICLGAFTSVRAADEAIDRLLKKLPPPETIVKPQIHREANKSDPAFNDPLAQKALNAFNAGNPSAALGSARQLAQKLPKSAYAHFIHAAVTLDDDLL